jgi:transposase
MNSKYIVKLTVEERQHLEKLVSSGEGSARSLMHARILLKSDRSEQGANWSYAQIRDALDVTEVTISKVRRAYAEQGLEAAVNRKKPDRVYATRLDGQAEAQLIALVCGAPPDGEARWSLRLLKDKLVALDIVDEVSYETVRRTLKKMNLSLG